MDSPSSQASFDPFLSRLGRWLGDRTPRRAPAGSFDLQAAVALILRPGPPGLELLFIQRAEQAGDPWSGHMAFPGGRRDPNDADLWATAARETLEETGIDLSLGSKLGQLDDVWPRSRRLPAIAVTPFVVAVPPWVETQPRPEVNATVWMPLAALRDPRNQSELVLTGPGGPRRFPSLVYGEFVVWGLTHEIVTQLLRILREND